jgi:hypothetical protein
LLPEKSLGIILQAFLREKGNAMQHILTGLQELNRLYHQDSLEAYEQLWQATAKLIQQAFPGFTIAYAELYNSGISRLSDVTMSHVLVPIAQQRENGNLATP